MGVPLTMVCDSADVDATTGVCAHPVWASVPPVLPEFDAGAGVAVGLAMWALWATCYGFRKLRRVAD